MTIGEEEGGKWASRIARGGSAFSFSRDVKYKKQCALKKTTPAFGLGKAARATRSFASEEVHKV